MFDLSLCPVSPAGAAASVPPTDADALAGAFRAWLDAIGHNEGGNAGNEVGTLFRTGTGTGTEESTGTSTEKSPDLISADVSADLVVADILIRWPLQAPPVQPIELITIRLAGQPAVDDEIATEVEADRPLFDFVTPEAGRAPIAAPVPFVPPVVPQAPVTPTPPQHHAGLATATSAVPPTPVAPQLFAAAGVAIGHPTSEPTPVEADAQAPAQNTERRQPATPRSATIEIPIEIATEPNRTASVPAAFTRMEFADLPPALRASLPQAGPIDPKWRSLWVETPAGPISVPLPGGQSTSTDSEPKDQSSRQSFRDLQVPAAVLRLAARDGVQLDRASDAAELVATVRDIARPGVALASLMAAVKPSAPTSDVTWTPMALTMAAPPFAHTAQAAPAVAFAEALPTLSPDTVDRTVDHIVRSISLAWARGRAEAQIKLNPSHFGEVAVLVKVENGRVVVRLEAEAAAVRDWLRANQSALSAALIDRELHLDQLEVSAPREESDSTSREQAQSRQSGQQAARRAKRDQPGQLFEVVE